MPSDELNGLSPVDPWSVDPILRFDRVHVLESLNTGFAGRSGRCLAEALESLAAGGPVKVAYHPVDGRDLLRAVLLAIVSEAHGLHMATSADQVWAALAWGAVPSVGLLVGAIAGSFSRMPHQHIAMAMPVGAGLLLAGVSLKVAADAIRVAGPIGAALSLLLGAAVFSSSNALLARFGAAHRKRCGECIQQPAESQQPGSGVAIALGNALDAAPEAMVLGIALRDPVVPFALVIAFSLGNLPVALSSTAGMRAAGRRYPYIFLLWSAIAIGAAVAIVAGYVGVGSLSQAWPPRLQAFGAGALLAMAAETMIPEAFHNSPRFSGLLAAFGFGLLLLVDATIR